ncbi:tyrosine-type recombinase/integrase, partial [Cesiribacter sp. SM1]|uniref:tyrosine-type recombinase/integrase n=1 Tax=Cesiribacter sp. SM1 TaxID=2861196 RepID=UPI001CD1F5C1
MSLPERLSSLSQFSDVASKYLKSGLEGAANTVRSYKADLDCYSAWCEKQGVPLFPATPETIANYIGSLAEHYKLATIQRRLAMLSKLHKLQGYESPTGHLFVKTVLDGIKREKGLQQKLAPAYSLGEFRSQLYQLDEGKLGELRDKALLLLGFTGAFRRNELISLDIEDLHFDERGILVEVKRSKTDQMGQGLVKAIFYGADPALCPVLTLKRWISTLSHKHGPLFVRVRKGDQMTSDRLTDQYVRLLVKKYLGDRYTAHSLRASFVTVSRGNGAGT